MFSGAVFCLMTIKKLRTIMKRLINNLFIATMMLLSALTYANTAPLFNVVASGEPVSAEVKLCLNGKANLSCQKYTVKAKDLEISTTVERNYEAAGIQSLTSGYQPSGCFGAANGNCLFALSAGISTQIVLLSTEPKQNQTISFTSTAPSATVGGPTYTPTAAASSGLPVTITVDSSSASICSISNGIVSFTAAGTCILNGDQAGDTSYEPAPQAKQNVSVTSLSASLVISSPTLVLAQNGIFTGVSGVPLAASKPRTLTITNQGQGIATSLSIAFNPALSGGTAMDTMVSTACTSATALAHNGSCTVTINPGTPSSIGNPPVTNTMTVTAVNASNNVTAAITTLTYGSLYGDGYVFSIDDSTAPTSSVGSVKVAAMVDQSSVLPWDADPACEAPSVCTYATGATSSTNGTNLSTPNQGNTYLIWNQLTNTTNSPTFPEAITSYAAGVCVNYVGGGHTDWYLPAICEMGYDAVAANSGCGASNLPTLQNMQSNLIDLDNSTSVALGLINGGLSGHYWSSTEDLNVPLVNAWFQLFSAGSSVQDLDTKFTSFGARCVRGFTN